MPFTSYQFGLENALPHLCNNVSDLHETVFEDRLIGMIFFR